MRAKPSSRAWATAARASARPRPFPRACGRRYRRFISAVSASRGRTATQPSPGRSKRVRGRGAILFARHARAPDGGGRERRGVLFTRLGAGGGGRGGAPASASETRRKVANSAVTRWRLLRLLQRVRFRDEPLRPGRGRLEV